MSNRINVSNATFDAALAAVPAPFGPLARDSGVDLEAEPRITLNSHTRYGVVGQNSVKFEISYDEVTNVNVRNDVLAEAYPQPYLNMQLRDFADLLYGAAFTNLPLLTGTEEQYELAMNLFSYFRPALMKAPVMSFEEESRKNKTKVDFTFSGSGASRSFVNTSVGYAITNWEWDWGDGTKSYVKNPGPKTWSVDGVYPVTLRAIGRGGVSSIVKSITIDVP